jgi:hypothetical protein
VRCVSVCVTFAIFDLAPRAAHASRHLVCVGLADGRGRGQALGGQYRMRPRATPDSALRVRRDMTASGVTPALGLPAAVEPGHTSSVQGLVGGNVYCEGAEFLWRILVVYRRGRLMMYTVVSASLRRIRSRGAAFRDHILYALASRSLMSQSKTFCFSDRHTSMDRNATCDAIRSGLACSRGCRRRLLRQRRRLDALSEPDDELFDGGAADVLGDLDAEAPVGFE